MYFFSAFLAMVIAAFPGTFPLKGARGNRPGIQHLGYGNSCVLGKGSCADQLLRDSWDGDRMSQSIRRVKPRGGAGGSAGWGGRVNWVMLSPSSASSPFNSKVWIMLIYFIAHMQGPVGLHSFFYSGKMYIIYIPNDYLANLRCLIVIHVFFFTFQAPWLSYILFI